MRLSTTDAYALHALGYLGTVERERWVASEHIAEATGVARPYLVRLLAALVGAGIVASKKGARGGYALARPAATISLRDVMRAIDGPIAPLSCVSLVWFKACPEQARCHARGAVYERLRDAMLDAMADITVADLAADVEAGIDYRNCLDHVMRASG